MPDYGDVNPDTGQTNARTDWGGVDELAPSVANGQITPAQWAEYQARRRRNFILGLLGTLGGATALGAVGQAFGGAGAAGSAGAGSAGGAATLPPAATAGMLPPSVAGGAGAGAAAAGGGLGGALAKFFGGLTPAQLAGLGLGAAGTIGGYLSNRNQDDQGISTTTTDPQLQALMSSMQRRLDKSEPLYDSALALANGLLPTRYQNGGGGQP